MDRLDLLNSLKSFTEKSISQIYMPMATQKGDTEQSYRSADVYLMRLDDSNASKKKVPYIIHQLITGKDAQSEEGKEISTAVVRSIFFVYSADEQKGALMLLTLMERLRIDLLKQIVLDKRYQLDLQQGTECLIYPDETAPYYGGEMVTNWILPSIQREVVI